MTVIVLDTDDNSIVLTADTQWASGEEMLIHYQTKIVRILRGTKQIGAVSSAGDAEKCLRFDNLVAGAFKTASPSSPPYVILRKLIDEAWTQKKCPEAIVVVRGQGFVVDPDGTITPQKRWSVGTGSHVALGAMHGRAGSAARLAKLGAQTACDLLATCGGEIDIFEMPVQHS